MGFFDSSNTPTQSFGYDNTNEWYQPKVPYSYQSSNKYSESQKKIRSILGLSDDTSADNNPYKQIYNYQQRINATGSEVPQEEHSTLQNLLTGTMGILDLTQRPLYAVANTINEGIKGMEGQEHTDLLQSAWEGLSGKKKTTTTSIFDTLGWKKEDNPTGKWYNPLTWNASNVVRGVLGFAGDVALDPLTYTGVLKGADMAGKGIIEGSDTAIDTVKSAYKAMGTDLADTEAKGLLQRMTTELGLEKPEDLTGTKVLDYLTGKQNELNNAKAELMGGKTTAEEVISKQNSAIGERLGFQRGSASVLPGLSGKQSLNKLNGETQETLYKKLDDVINTNMPAYDSLGKEGIAKKIIQRDFDNLDEVGKSAYNVEEKLNDLVDNHSIDQLYTADAICEAYGTKIASENALKTAEGFVKNATGENLGRGQKFLESAYKESNAKLAYEEGAKTLQFANGLTYTYNVLKNQSHLSFMGKPFMNFTEKVTNPMAKVFDNFLNKHEGVESFVDTVGKLVGKSEYITHAQKRLDPAKYSQLQDMAHTITEFMRKETAIPQGALEMVKRMYMAQPELFSNEKLLKAIPYFMEGADTTAPELLYKLSTDNIEKLRANLPDVADDIIDMIKDNKDPERWTNIIGDGKLLTKDQADAFVASNARRKWLDIQSGLTNDELKLVTGGATQTNTLNQIIYDMDKKNGFIYDPIANYVYHDYTNMSKEQAKKLLKSSVTSTQRDRVAGTVGIGLKNENSRTIESLADAVAYTNGKLVPQDNILAIMATRYMNSQRAELNLTLRGYLEGLARGGTVATKSERVAKTEGFQELKQMISGTYSRSLDDMGRDLKKVYVDPEVISQLNRLDQLYTNDNALNEALRHVASVNNFIKTMQTSLNPSFLGRNVVGEMLMNWMDDVKGNSYDITNQVLKDTTQGDLVRVGDALVDRTNPDEAIIRLVRNNDIVAGKRVPTTYRIELGKDSKLANTDEWVQFAKDNGIDLKGMTIDPEKLNDTFSGLMHRELKARGIKMYNIGNKEYTANEIMDTFYNGGLGWSGITKGNLAKNVEQNVSEATYKGLNPLKQYAKVTGEIGDKTETYARLSHMIDSLDRGMTVDEAMTNVRKFHVDYRDLTPFEKNVMRNIAPYYTYMRKNTPMQIKMALENPSRIVALGALLQNSYDALGNPETPDYLKETLALPLYKDDKGNTHYLNWNLPITDIGRFQYTLKGLWQSNVVDMLNPLIKSPFELGSNTSMSFNMPIEKYEGETTSLIPGVDYNSTLKPGVANTGIGKIASTLGGVQIPKQADYLLQELGIANTVRNTLGQAMVQPDSNNPKGTPMLQSLLPVKNAQQVNQANAYAYRDRLQDYTTKLTKRGVKVPTIDDLKKLGLTLP